MNKFIILIISGLIYVLVAEQIAAANSVQIIPQPNEIIIGEGSFTLSKNTRIMFLGQKEAGKIAKILAELLNKSTENGFKVYKFTDAKSTILFQLEKKLTINPGAYTVNIKKRKIIISSSTSQGLFYGFQTLRQLLPATVEGKGSMALGCEIPCVTIKDAPRYGYRGLHLDVSRHFFDKYFIMKYIDMMAMYKYNKFHWHLTDDQGWRVEIKKYPLLTKVGAFRVESNGNSTGGFYTQDEIKEVVAYARERFVDIIPEIEMPGHSVAVLAAYPDLSCSGGPFTVPTNWGIFYDVFCAGNDSVYHFMKDVLAEIIPLFPYKYIHIGGDECKKTRWKRCVKCQQKIRQEGLKDEQELQSYFIHSIEEYLQSKGKEIIGWDEILEGGISSTATIMSWRGTKGGIAAAQKGNWVIMTPGSHCYFNYYQGNPLEEPQGVGNGRFLPLQKVYTFDPTPKELAPEYAKFILGGQANVWSEHIDSNDLVEYMVFPRALAMIECLWTQPQHKNYQLFEQKIHAHYIRMNQYGISFSRSADKESTKKKIMESK
ncbi:MAG: beta-N-acetylhexosaminidase [Bacteroidales bacterium]|nr:beta-N-acetylhexosaminidase [Bacteroidales bacterium]